MKRAILLVFLALAISTKGQPTLFGTVTDSNAANPINKANIAVIKVFPKNVITKEPDTLTKEKVKLPFGLQINKVFASSAIQNIAGAKLNPTRQTNINNILAGKVAGIKVYGQAAMALGRTGRIGIRGQGGFSTGNQPIYLVDGTVVNDISDISYDEIADVTVLSGPASAAILGSQGAYGAIVINTKRFSDQPNKFGVEVNSGFMATHVYILPQHQNTYSGGALSDMARFDYIPGYHPSDWSTLDGKYYHEYSDDASWGPKMVGQEYIPWYSWYPGTKYTGKTAKLIPQPDNIRDFYNTGSTYNNSIVLSKSTKDFSIRTSIGNVNTQGLIPGTSVNKYNLTLKADYKTFERLTISTNINFFTSSQRGEIDDDYSNASTGIFNQWFHRNLDMGKLKELKGLQWTPGGYASWNHNNPTTWSPTFWGYRNFYAGNYWDNPFDYFDLNKVDNHSDILYGDITATYNISEGISLKTTYRRNQNNYWTEEKYDSYLDYYHLSNWGQYHPGYETILSSRSIQNYQGILSVEKKINDILIRNSLGTDFFTAVYKENSESTVNGLRIPNLFAISNSRETPSIINSRSDQKYRAVFNYFALEYKNLFSLDFNLRNEWHSTLPPNKNSLLSKSVGGTFIFTNLVEVPYLNFGKIRAAWGEIPTSIGVYQYPGVSYNYRSSYSYYENILTWNGKGLMTTPNSYVDHNIHGAAVSQKEIGIDLALFQGKLDFSATYWVGKEKGIPYTVPISEFSGYSSVMINTGEIIKKGIDLQLGIRPIANSKVTWVVNGTFSYLMDNKIVKIYSGIDQFTVLTQWGSGTPDVVHVEGEQWGMLVGGGKKLFQAYDVNGKKYSHPSNGKPILNSNGLYVSDPKVNFGNVLPKITGGVQSNLTFMSDFTFSFSIDYQFGGKFFSLSDMWGTYSGLTARTAGINDKGNPIRDPVIEGGGVHTKGVDASGHQVDYYVEAQDYFHGLYYNDVYNPMVYSLTYIKLREVSLGYTIPVKKLGVSSWIQNAQISIVFINPWLIYAKQKNFDPSELSNIGGERAQFPSARSFGTNLRISF